MSENNRKRNRASITRVRQPLTDMADRLEEVRVGKLGPWSTLKYWHDHVCPDTSYASVRFYHTGTRAPPVAYLRAVLRKWPDLDARWLVMGDIDHPRIGPDETLYFNVA